MKKILQACLVVFTVLSVAVALPQEVLAVNVCDGDAASSMYCTNKEEDVNSIIKAVVDLLLMAVAIISVIVIIVGGIFFALANGDSARVAKARNTVLYAVIGLVVSLFSYAIVQFVFNRVDPASSSGSASHFST